jgi:hypothetical protein
MGLRSSSRLWRLAAALTPFPVVALGYFAAQPGSHLAFQLEVLLSGEGSAHVRPAITQPEALAERDRLGPQALKLFSRRGKGPRADLFSESELALENRDDSPVAAAFAPVGDLTGALGSGRSPFAMARQGKSDRDAVTDVMRMAGPQMRDVTAAMFMVSPVGVSGDAYVADPEEGLLKNAAWKPSKEDFITYQGETEAEFQARERRCLAIAIYFEARGEPIEGQQAVAQVVMNRVRSPLYPDTICGVVYQGDHRKTGCQFSFTCDRKADTPKDMTLWAQAEDIARDVTQGKVWLDDIGHSSHYHATYVNPVWKRHMNKIKQVGRHIFYRLKKEDPYIVEEIANEAADQGDDEIAETKTEDRVAGETVAANSAASGSSDAGSANFFSFSNVFGGGSGSSQAPVLGYSSN